MYILKRPTVGLLIMYIMRLIMSTVIYSKNPWTMENDCEVAY